MEELLFTEAEKQEIQEVQKTKDKRSKEKLDSGATKIQLPQQASQRILELQAQLKERGYNGKIDDILGTIWDQINNEWCEARLEALTPDDYYLNAIKSLPEVRQKIVDQAKKALIKSREEMSKNN